MYHPRLFPSPGFLGDFLQQGEKRPRELEVAHDVRMPLKFVSLVRLGTRGRDHHARGAEEDVEFRFFRCEFRGGCQRGTEVGEVEVDEVWFVCYRWLFGREAFDGGVEELFVPAEDVDLGVSLQECFLPPSDQRRNRKMRGRLTVV